MTTPAKYLREQGVHGFVEGDFESIPSVVGAWRAPDGRIVYTAERDAMIRGERTKWYAPTMNSALVPKIIGSIFVLVVASFLAANVHPLLALLALLVLFFWL